MYFEGEEIKLIKYIQYDIESYESLHPHPLTTFYKHCNPLKHIMLTARCALDNIELRGWMAKIIFSSHTNLWYPSDHQSITPYRLWLNTQLYNHATTCTEPVTTIYKLAGSVIWYTARKTANKTLETTKLCGIPKKRNSNWD